MKVLVYGYGNPGRQDDGLGIALVEKLEDWARRQNLDEIEFENNYQLNIEDAEAISEKDLVVFVDASDEEIDDFCISKVEGEGKLAFTTHSASPGYILKLCQELFQKRPRVLLVHIKGYEWDFKEGISARGGENLEQTFEALKDFLKQPEDEVILTDKIC